MSVPVSLPDQLLLRQRHEVRLGSPDARRRRSLSSLSPSLSDMPLVYAHSTREEERETEKKGKKKDNGLAGPCALMQQQARVFGDLFGICRVFKSPCVCRKSASGRAGRSARSNS